MVKHFLTEHYRTFELCDDFGKNGGVSVAKSDKMDDVLIYSTSLSSMEKLFDWKGVPLHPAHIPLITISKSIEMRVGSNLCNLFD